MASSRFDRNLQKHVELTMEVEAIRRRGEFLITHQNLSVVRKDRIMVNYQREVYAASSASSRESHLRT